MTKRIIPIKRFHILLCLLLASIIVVTLGFFIYRRSHPKNPNVIPSQKTTEKQSLNTSRQTTTSTLPSDQSPKNTTSGNGSVAAFSGEIKNPYGTFVSNHKPQVNDQEGSTCITNPGATCYIQFTKGDTVKKLDAQQVDGTGSASWVWKISEAGLGSGSWQVVATATLNGQTKSTTDQISLEIR